MVIKWKKIPFLLYYVCHLPVVMKVPKICLIELLCTTFNRFFVLNMLDPIHRFASLQFVCQNFCTNCIWLSRNISSTAASILWTAKPCKYQCPVQSREGFIVKYCWTMSGICSIVCHLYDCCHKTWSDHWFLLTVSWWISAALSRNHSGKLVTIYGTDFIPMDTIPGLCWSEEW